MFYAYSANQKTKREIMNQTETDELLRARRNLTGATYNADTVRDWHAVLHDVDYQPAYRALLEAARDEKRITPAHLCERLPKPTTGTPATTSERQLCITCELEYPPPGRTRCTPCQTTLDRNGTTSPAMHTALAQARKTP